MYNGLFITYTCPYPVHDWTRSTRWPIITPSNARNFIVSQGSRNWPAESVSHQDTNP